MSADETRTEREELDAAERALGTEPRGAVGGAMGARIRMWDRTLLPLIHALPDIPPPPELKQRLMRMLSEEIAMRQIGQARRSAQKAWGLTAVSALVAGFAGVMLLRQPAPVPAFQPRYVAVVTPQGGGEALVVAIDVAAGEALVTPVGLAAPEGRDLQLWAIEGEAAPRPLGLVETDGTFHLPLDAAPGAVIAVSSEPPGGSPTGLPTGPVLYTGPLVAVE